MNALLFVESCFGSTRALAEEVAAGLREGGAQADVVPAARAALTVSGDVSLLVLAAPTHNRGLPTPASRHSARSRGGSPEEPGMREWLGAATIPDGTRVLAIDTVTRRNWVSGSAARQVARMLRPRSVGTRSFVAGSRGPLNEGEARAARTWGAGLL